MGVHLRKLQSQITNIENNVLNRFENRRLRNSTTMNHPKEADICRLWCSGMPISHKHGAPRC